MEIINQINNRKALLTLKGRLDTITAPELEKILVDIYPQVDEIVFDMKSLDYISSAGLRVMLTAQKIMSVRGKVTLCHVKDSVMDVFDMTGFSSLLNIEK